MRYQPEDAQQCLPAGRYQALVSEAKESVSKPKPDGTPGSPMVVVTYTVYSDRGNRKLTDYITVPSSLWKLKGLAAAIGKEKEFESGEFRPSDYEGETLDVDLEIETDAKGQYPDKNRVKRCHKSGMKSVLSSVRSNGGQAAPAPTRPRAHDPSTGEVAPVDESKIPF